jgi:hypothetical protein
VSDNEAAGTSNVSNVRANNNPDDRNNNRSNNRNNNGCGDHQQQPPAPVVARDISTPPPSPLVGLEVEELISQSIDVFWWYKIVEHADYRSQFHIENFNWIMA